MRQVKPALQTLGMLIIICFLIITPLSAQQRILPSADFGMNFSRLPFAWTLTKGANIKLSFVENDTAVSNSILKRLKKAVPEAKINLMSTDNFFSGASDDSDVIYFSASPQKGRTNELLARFKAYSETGKIIIVPVLDGRLTDNSQLAGRQEYIRGASEAGCIIAAGHGMEYQIGSWDFYSSWPVDVWAINGGFSDETFGEKKPAAKVSCVSSGSLVASAAVLLKAIHPDLRAGAFRQILMEHSRNILFVKFKGDVTQAFLNDEGIKRFKRKHGLIREKGRMEIRSLDVALLTGVTLSANQTWTQNALNLDSMRNKVTGKGITVAVLDWLFNPDDPDLKDHYVKPYSVVEGEKVLFGDEHGTSMCKELLSVAPDVKIMPVRIYFPGRSKELADFYMKGIEYAVENGADVISLSHQPIEPEKQAAFDAVIEKAIAKGVVFVYIHYAGKLEGVVVPGPIEFASYHTGENRVFTVGTNHMETAMFPYTWGYSGTAPDVAGVVALIKEVNSSLTPRQIRDILLESQRPTPDGFPLLDASIALEKARK
jgi:hypothetical protein